MRNPWLRRAKLYGHPYFEDMRKAVLLLALTLPLVAQKTASAPNKVTFSTNEIKGVLLLARESALKEEYDEGQMQGGTLPGHLQVLMAGFRSINDWADAVVLRDHVNEDHKVDVVCAPPHATLADYKALRRSVKKLDEYHHDDGLLRLIDQELTDKFLDEAERSANDFLDFQRQSDAYIEIALSRWKAGDRNKAGQLFQSATNAALKMKPMFGEPDQTAERIPGQLSKIAEQQYLVGDEAGALELLRRSKAMAQDAGGFRDNALEGIALTQCRLGLLSDARDTAAALDRFKEDVLEEISEQETLEPSAKEATKQILGLADSGAFKARMLTSLASKQKDSGEIREAIKTLDRAFRVVRESDPTGVRHPANARDIGFSHRLIAIGYSDMEENQKAAAVLRNLASIKEASSSTLDRYDYLFDLAAGYAGMGDFSRAHGFVDEMGKYPNEQACEIVGDEATRHGHAEEAVRWAKKLKDLGARTSALVGISSAMLDIAEAGAAR
jgi:tetratricopeptide (TPR) repeat protein